METVVARVMDSLNATLISAADPFASQKVAVQPMLNVPHLVAANVAYLVVLAVLYFYMEGREAFRLTWFMRFYNLSCVLLAGGVVYGCYDHYRRFGGMSIYGSTTSFDARTESGLHMHHVVWLYYIQKFWEFLDTIIFVLRKSKRQITFLHLYHHTSITVVTYIQIVYGHSSDLFLPALLNCIVHVFMYSHYLVATFKMSTPWKPLLTQMQLVQFVMIMAQVVAGWVAGSDVSYPDWCKMMLFLYMVTMLVLFGRFYVKSYGKPKDAAAAGKEKGKKTQ